MTPAAKARVVKRLARAVGFDRVGIAPAGPLERRRYYRDWLAGGYQGSMAYLGRNVHLRENPAGLLPGSRSIICVALSYHGGAVTAPDTGQPVGRVAAYARGRDYHVVVRQMLAELVGRLRGRLDEPFEDRICVDTAPVLERELACAAGLGWIGKNTCLLDEELGSYVFLGEAITTLELAFDQPVADRCGECRRCLEACPTRAFLAPYQLDASRCISYLTIEHRGDIPGEFHEALGDRVFGCDVCQEVCPYNRKARLATHADIAAEYVPAFVGLLDLLGLSSGEYGRLTKGSAGRRARRAMWRRNAAIALGNAGDLRGEVREEVRRGLARAVHDEDVGVGRAAACSLGRISDRWED